MAKIHPTALVSPKARLGIDVEIGPYCVVGEGVQLGARTKLISHISISGKSVIGEDCTIYPFTTIGAPPQDLKYEGEASRVFIGDGTIIRENVTINLGTQGGGMETRIGKNVFVMACAHVAHDCQIGDHVVLANAVLLAGHCVVGDWAVLGGAVLCQQFLHIGAHCFIGGGSGLNHHMPPFTSASGYPATFRSLNAIGLKRRGFNLEDIKMIRQFYEQFFMLEGDSQKRILLLEKQFSGQHIDEIIAFIKSLADSRHGLMHSQKRLRQDRE